MDAVRDVELRAVEDVRVALSERARADGLHVGARVRLRDGDRGDHFAADDTRHPAGALGVGPIVEDIPGSHVGMDQHRIGDAAIGRAPEFLGEDRRCDRVHLGTTILGRVADTEEAQFAHAAQDRTGNESVFFPAISTGLDLFLDEPADLVP